MARLPPRSQRRPSNSLATASSTATAPVNVVQPSGSKPKRGLNPIRQNHISHWRKISITLKTLGGGILSVMAFHEKAGRSQVGSFVFSLDKFFSPAEWPLSPCFHSHSRGATRALGADWAFSLQPVLPSDWRPVVLLFESGTLGQAINAVTGTRLWAFDFPLPGTVLTFLRLSYAAAGTVVRLLLCNGW